MAYDDMTRYDTGDDRRNAGAPTWGDEEAALRRDMDARRERISDTVSQIEYRVRPDYIWARRRASARQRMTGWKDAVFGSHDDGPDADREGLFDRGRERGAEAAHAVGQAPTALRRQTRGNPFAAGAVALGAGWLVGSLLPETQPERQLAAKAEPKLAEKAAAAKDELTDAAHSVQDAARDAADHVKEAGRDAVQDVAQEGKDAARSVGDGARSTGSTER
jgi:hypothetical protein